MVNKPEYIDEWIGRFLAGEADPEEAMALEDWMAENPAHARYVEDCRRIYTNHVQYAGAEIDTEAAWHKVQQQLHQEAPVKELKISPRNGWMRLAAGLMLIAVLSVVLVYILKKPVPEDIVYNSGDSSAQVKLADGTEVTVEPHSSLVVNQAYDGGQRYLRLKGSAYFNVVHHEDQPMVVDIGRIFIKDIGTRFRIYAPLDTDTVYVKVDEGIVLLFDSLGSSVEIRASEKALYIRSLRRIVKEGIGSGAIQAGHIQFAATPLRKVISNLSRLYGQRIILENESLENCTITTEFKNENLETILSIITETLGLKFEKTKEGYLIRGTVCHS